MAFSNFCQPALAGKYIRLAGCWTGVANKRQSVFGTCSNNFCRLYVVQIVVASLHAWVPAASLWPTETYTNKGFLVSCRGNGACMARRQLDAEAGALCRIW
jgi:hypothetical protein